MKQNFKKVAKKILLLPLYVMGGVTMLLFIPMYAIDVYIRNDYKLPRIVHILLTPLVYMAIFLSIPIALLAQSLLSLTRVLLFPKLFFSLWFEEGIKFSHVLTLFSPEILGNKSNITHSISSFKTFLKIKDNDKELLLEFLKRDYGYIYIRFMIFTIIVRF